MSKLLLFYDTETSGLPLWNEPSEDHRQPHIVQLAAVLFDIKARTTVQSINLIVRPDGWNIPEEVSAIHGITTLHATRVGISEQMALDVFMALHSIASVRIAHNESFDMRILRIALLRFGDADTADKWKSAPFECTAKLATSHCALPPTEKMIAAGRRHYKTPTMSEAYKHFTGQELVGAHSAMTDVQACIAVYLAIRDGKRAGIDINAA